MNGGQSQCAAAAASASVPRWTRLPFATAALCCPAAFGCAASSLSPLHFSVRHLTEVNRGNVFDIAQAVLLEMSYPIARADPFEGVILTQPIEVSPVRDDAAASARPAPQAARRVAEVRLAEQHDGVGVYCRVLIQQQVTETHRLLWGASGSSDLPDATPLERGGAGTPEQNTVWRTVSRNKAVERRILENIVERHESARNGARQ